MDNYLNLDIKGEVIDNLLGILLDYMKLNSSETEYKFITLDLLLKQEGAQKTLIEKLNFAKEISKKLKPYSSHCKDYFKHFKELEQAIYGIQEEFLEIYRKTA